MDEEQLPPAPYLVEFIPPRKKKPVVVSFVTKEQQEKFAAEVKGRKVRVFEVDREED